MPKDPHLLIIAGDLSADRHAAALVDALKAARPNLRVSALGGSALKSKADAFIYPLAEVGGFGFWEPLLKLPQLLAARQRVRQLLTQNRPDLVVPMDYYGFNIHIARLTKSLGIPVAYYISPQVWASRPGRIQKLAEVVSRMLVIFPFEEALYRQAGVPVTFVGHPLLERLPAPEAPAVRPTIGLLPGSRLGTLKRHVPLLIQTAQILRQEFPQARCLLFRPVEIPKGFYDAYLQDVPWIELTTDPDYGERRKLSLAITVSGTAALENMLLGIPMIIMYRLSTLTYWIAKHLIRVPFVGIPNILAGKSVVPELLQHDATSERLAESAKDLLRDTAKREKMRDMLLGLRATLMTGGTQRAAGEILGMLS